MTGNLIKSKDRVKAHGEVFTPAWMVDLMLKQDGIAANLLDPYSTFLEPAAGDGNFLVAILQQKLDYINETYKGTTRDVKSLWALSSLYGIEILMDNLLDARNNLLITYMESYSDSHKKPLRKQNSIYKSAKLIIEKNIQQGDTLTYKNNIGDYITFSHWWRVKGTINNVHRELFTYESLFHPQWKQLEPVPLFEFEDENNHRIPDNGSDHRLITASQNTEYKIVPIKEVYKELTQ